MNHNYDNQVKKAIRGSVVCAYIIHRRLRCSIILICCHGHHAVPPQESPLPVDPSMFPTWPAKSEKVRRKSREKSPTPPIGGNYLLTQVCDQCSSITYLIQLETMEREHFASKQISQEKCLADSNHEICERVICHWGIYVLTEIEKVSDNYAFSKNYSLLPFSFSYSPSSIFFLFLFLFLPLPLKAEEDGFKITSAVHGKAAVGAGFSLKF